MQLGKQLKNRQRMFLPKLMRCWKKAGTDKSKLLTSSIWLKDMKTDYDGFNDVWNHWIDPDQKPVRATVENPMARPILLIEVQVTAAVGR